MSSVSDHDENVGVSLDFKILQFLAPLNRSSTDQANQEKTYTYA